ncbi:hypothetical protein N7493_009777 [Penicillium malachiteum]|uniref:Tyrosine specific protein phosphatases domain-containing protein n=1 Tax=Penicillium malachiteum TaxID=1324776 RepID=A0AAD6HF92_9EURO|nr:hypothetical protein N7493_009777 [Penicillium malachiteum]
MASSELSFLSSILIPGTSEQVRHASESPVVEAPGNLTSSAPAPAPAPNPTAAVLIHCVTGKSRSPTIVIALLMQKLRIPFTEIIKFVKSKQKVQPNRGFLRQLEAWDQVEYQIWEDEEKTVPKAAYKDFLEEQKALLKERELKKTLQPEPAKL